MFKTLLVLAVSVASGSSLHPSPRPEVAAQAPAQRATADARLLGQRIMVGMTGTAPDSQLLGAARRGAIGGVILFSSNLVDRRQVSSLTGALQRAARQGGNPPLLIAVDQEGGQVRRFSHGPPFLSPPQMGARRSGKLAFREGAMTGHYLKSRGINMDLAPVLDVPSTGRAFIWRQGRAFSFDAGLVATLGEAFAKGLQSSGVAATGKHFPGLGSAGVDTDNARQELQPPATERKLALVPYRYAIPRGLDAVMLSTAGFPAYDRTGASAALSRPIIAGLLRGRLRFGGLTITDSLSSPTGHDEISAGVIAASAGADVLLYVDSAAGELSALESALHGGRVARAAAVASYQRIVRLKRKLG